MGRSMFYNVQSFNADLSAWNTEKVTEMYWMFGYAYRFNADLSAWNTERVTSMFKMFYYASSFQQNVCPWLTKNPRFPNNIDTSWMFSNSGCPNKNDPTNSNACFYC